jgi:hypothetical protein
VSGPHQVAALLVPALNRGAGRHLSPAPKPPGDSFVHQCSPVGLLSAHPNPHPHPHSNQSGFVDALNCLHEHGANLDCRRLNGQTPAHGAAILGQLDILKRLHELGCAVLHPNYTPQLCVPPLTHGGHASYDSCTS